MEMTEDRTTARAQRRQTVADGSAVGAVDRRTARSNPGGNGRQTGTRNTQRERRREIADELEYTFQSLQDRGIQRGGR